MDSFEWNKIAGWVLAAAIAVLGLSIVTGIVYMPYVPEKTAYVVEGVEVEAEATAPGAAAEPPIEALLASASLEKGAAVFKKCASCHTIDKGAGNGIGPNLWGVMGQTHAHAPGFGYSAALSGKKGEPWDWTAMNAWLKSPKAAIPGNKMSFAGLGKPDDRAAVIAYLNSKSDSPLPLPAAPEAGTEAAAPAAAGSVAPGSPTAAGGSSGGTPTADKPAPQAGKAPDVPASATPEQPTGGPGAPEVSGTAKRDLPQTR